MMTERITHSSVTFLHAFLLRDEGVQPPGTYLIETAEEPLGNLSFLAYRRVSTTITLPAVGTPSLSKQVVTVDRTSCVPPWSKTPWLRQVTAKQGGHESVLL